jgi:hypothetical protein
MGDFGRRMKKLLRLSPESETEAETSDAEHAGQREIFDAQNEAFLVVDVFDLGDGVNLRDLDSILRKASMATRGYPKCGRS